VGRALGVGVGRIGVAVAVGVGVEVAVGVGVGVAPPIVPMSRNIWSDSPVGLPVQHSLNPQVMQRGHGLGHPGGQSGGGGKKPPGFCQAALLFACTVRLVQPHWPKLELM
jgi:hypothetical protein